MFLLRRLSLVFHTQYGVAIESHAASFLRTHIDCLSIEINERVLIELGTCFIGNPIDALPVGVAP